VKHNTDGVEAWGDAAVALLKDPEEKDLANPYLYTKKQTKPHIMAQKKHHKKVKKVVHKAKPKAVEEEKP